MWDRTHFSYETIIAKRMYKEFASDPRSTRIDVYKKENKFLIDFRDYRHRILFW